MPMQRLARLIYTFVFVVLTAAPAFAELPARGYQPRLCGLDMNRNGIVGEAADCNVCTGDMVNKDPDGDGDFEDIIYVSCAKGATASRPAGADTAGCGQTPDDPCLTIAHAWTNEANGTGPDNHEDIVCFRNICVEEELSPAHSGEATTYQMPPSPSEAQQWIRPSNPAMLIGWDSDGDHAYPPEDEDDLAVLEPEETCPGTPNFPCAEAPIKNPLDSRRRFHQKEQERAIFLGGNISHVELAHFTVRDYGRFTLTDNAGFIEFHVQGNDYIDIHDLHLLDINRHSNFTSANSTVNFFRFRANHVRFENLLVLNNGHWLARGDGGNGPTTTDGGPYGPTRWQNLTVKQNACFAPEDARCDPAIHCPESEFPPEEYPLGCCATGPICLSADPADCDPDPTETCTPHTTTQWKLWGYLSGMEILDSVIDTNLSDRENVVVDGDRPRAIDMTQCSQDWTVRNNEIIDWAAPIEAAPESDGACDTAAVARPVDNVVIDQNIIEMRRFWGFGKYAIRFQPGGDLAGQTVGDVTITNNIISTTSAWEGCFLFEAGNNAAPPDNTVIFSNNTCDGSVLALGQIFIGAPSASNNQTFMPQHFIIKNNLISGGGGDENVATSYIPSMLEMDYNVFDPDGSYRWNGVAQASLAAWQAASGRDANSAECVPLYVDGAGGDFHLDPSDTCAQDQGTPLVGTVVADIDGDERGQGTGWDIGADEVPSATVPEADLGLTARALPDSTSVGGVVRYLVMVTNFGPDAAPDTTVTTEVPAGLSYTTDTCGAGAPSGSTWNWGLGTVTPNATERIRPRCLITFQATGAGVQPIDTSVGSSVDDPVAGNDQVITNVTVN